MGVDTFGQVVKNVKYGINAGRRGGCKGRCAANQDMAEGMDVPGWGGDFEDGVVTCSARGGDCGSLVENNAQEDNVP